MLPAGVSVEIHVAGGVSVSRTYLFNQMRGIWVVLVAEFSVQLFQCSFPCAVTACLRQKLPLGSAASQPFKDLTRTCAC